MNTWLVEIFLSVLMLISFVFFWKLSRRLDSVEKIEGTLPSFLTSLSSCMQKLSTIIQTLRQVSQDSRTFFSKDLPEFSKLKEDLTILIEHGEKLARRLDYIIEQAQASEHFLKKCVSANIQSCNKDVNKISMIVEEEPFLQENPFVLESLPEVIVEEKKEKLSEELSTIDNILSLKKDRFKAKKDSYKEIPLFHSRFKGLR